MADNGARSQFAQLVFTVVLLALTGPLPYLPQCVFAALVFTIAVGIDFRGLAEIRRESHGEFLLALETAAAVLELGVGIPFAIARSVIRYVRHNYEPRTAVLTP
jgi:SulP family sulfate permease